MTQYPAEAYAALDRLNSWIRAPGAWSLRSPKFAIYDWKIELIRNAAASNEARLRAICVTLRCRDCGGDGKYMDSSGHEWPHCRRCASTGLTRLTFLESAMHGFTWHTPRDRAWTLHLPSDFFDSAAEVDEHRTPNQHGMEMLPWEVAACLNILEPIMPKPSLHRTEWGERDDAGYRLNIGRGPKCCEFCGTPSEDDRNGVYHYVCRDHLEWSAWACNVCKKQFANSMQWCEAARKYLPAGGNGRSIFDEFKLPVIEHPEIIAWLARRRVKLEAAA